MTRQVDAEEMQRVALWALSSHLGWRRHGQWADDELGDALEAVVEAARTWDSDGGRSYASWALQAITWRVMRERGRRGGWGRSGYLAFNRGETPRPVGSLNLPTHDSDRRKIELGDLVPEDLPDQPGSATRIDPSIDLDAILEALPPKQRVLVTHGTEEAADLLGIKPMSARRSRHRLYARLRSELAS